MADVARKIGKYNDDDDCSDDEPLVFRRNILSKKKEVSNRTCENRAVRSSVRLTNRTALLDVLRNQKKLRQQGLVSCWKRRDADTSVKQRGLSPIDYYDRRWGYDDCDSDIYDDFFDSTIENETNFRLSNTEMMPEKEKSKYTRKDTSPLHAVNLSAPSTYRNQKRLREDEDSTGGMGDNLKESSVITYEDVKGITIKRSNLAKLFTKPFFEELIVGCFVRVRIGMSKTGPTYCLCIVRNVDAADPDRHYKLENKTTHKYLNVVWGNDYSIARWQMDMVSDSPPKKEEFEQLIREVELRGGRMPSKQEVLDKADAVEKCSSYVYYAESVKQMFPEKKSKILGPWDFAVEQDRLKKDMEVAQRNYDEWEAEKLKAKLLELVASRQTQQKDTQQKDSNAISLAEMEGKNPVENLKNVSEVKLILQELFAKAGEAGWNSKKPESFWVESEKAEILAQKTKSVQYVERCQQRNLDVEFLRTDILSYPEEVRELIQQQKVKIINNLLTGYYDV